jgi:putative ABC transport system ATP-binding protein
LILADEPTGNLDTATEKEIVGILKKLATDYGCCVIVVTHSDDIAATSDVKLRLSEGCLVEEMIGESYHG